jgi:ABC-type antimicrobial peptide transport system permease subunit
MQQFTKMTGIADAGMTFVLRTSGDPLSLKAGAREVIRQIDSELALNNVQSLASVVENSVSRPRFAASVLGSFGIAALVLAVIGVYGVLSFAMARRRRELAVRMALGAHARDVTALVMRSGLGVAAVGVAVGVAAALAGGKLLEALLYDIKPTDPATLGAVVAMLLAAAAAASWVPARRATTVSPAEVLRGE